MSLTRWLYCAIFLCPNFCLAAYSNSSSLLLGNQSAGLGGAYVALTEDTTALPFFNPAGIALVKGREFSANLTLYNKYETEFGETQNLLAESLRLNQGFFQSIPAASSSVISYGSFAVALSILTADFEHFSGEIFQSDDQSSFLRFNDESTWFGGNIGLNLDGENSVGLSIYYTARSFTRSITDELQPTPTSAQVRTEEKSLTNNSLVYILGMYRQLSQAWSFGLSYRFPSIEISGKGDFYQSQIQTTPFDSQTIRLSEIKSETKIPGLLRMGVAYRDSSRIFSFEVTYSEPIEYFDMESAVGRDLVRHQGTWNASMGAELRLRRWLKWRFGLYSNFSSAKEPQSQLNEKQLAKVHMWGFSSNIGLYSTDNISWSIGGYYTGGRGKSIHEIGSQWSSLPKDQKIFSFVLGTSYAF